jgi:3' terminal RNA ribose 2'-O-methyltransferase Hen1
MLLTISTTHEPATDLGYLLAKNPDSVQSFPLAYGQAHVFYPVATQTECTAALLLEIDPVGLVRGRPPGDPGTIAEYVNDRPYVASSLLSVAIAQVFSSALNGKSRERQSLAEQSIDLEATIESVPCRGGEALLRRLFEPLGYAVTAARIGLDEQFPDWGQSPYFRVTLRATTRLQSLLAHLYVLIPVLDDDKHYWVGDAEVEKLIAKGEGWLSTHPEKDQIALRYLKHRRSLARAALARLTTDEGVDLDEQDDERARAEEAVEAKLSLNEQRIQAVISALKSASARSVIDLGCGEGKLLSALVADKAFGRLAGADVSPHALEVASRRLKLDPSSTKKARLTLFQSALTYRDKRLSGFDAATLVEVIEHVDPARLPALEQAIFGSTKPRVVIVTTPNADYNVRFEDLPTGRLRHADHRFEWSRLEFKAWVARVASSFGYSAVIQPIGPVDDALGAPTQMAIFSTLSLPEGAS